MTEGSSVVLVVLRLCVVIFFFFFFNDTATTEIYTLSLHDALPTSSPPRTYRLPPGSAKSFCMSTTIRAVSGSYLAIGGPSCRCTRSFRYEPTANAPGRAGVVPAGGRPDRRDGGGVRRRWRRAGSAGARRSGAAAARPASGSNRSARRSHAASGRRSSTGPPPPARPRADPRPAQAA